MRDKEITAGIVSVGVYIPKTCVTAAEVAEQSGVPKEIIEEKQGWRRKHVPGPDDHPISMGVWAAQDALKQTDIKLEEIDVVLCTVDEYRDYMLQLPGPKLAYELGARRAWAIDLGQRCGTNIGALKIAKDILIADDDVNTVLVAGGYRIGDLVDYSNPNSRFLLGLGAGGGAFLVRKNYPRNHILGTAMITDGSFSDDLLVPAGGSRIPITKEALDKRMNYIDSPDYQDMKRRLEPISLPNFMKVTRDALNKSGYTERDLGYVALVHMKKSFHDVILRELGVSEEQSIRLEEYGHTGQMDMPILLKQGLESGRIKDGTLIAMISAGNGYTWGATIVKWGPATG